MIYHGHVENGHIILHGPVSLPEGTEVRVDVVCDNAAESPGDSNAPSLYDRLKPAIGTAKGLPPDAARNVDHHLYGHPQR